MCLPFVVQANNHDAFIGVCAEDLLDVMAKLSTLFSTLNSGEVRIFWQDLYRTRAKTD
jgi:hypothetical protein